MRLLSIDYQRFRNLSALRLTPSSATTVAVGDNGQGKTNILEGLYYVATLKILRGGKLADLVQFGTPGARISARFLLGGAEREVSVEVSPHGRTAYVDGKRATSLTQYFGGASVVAFTPDDLAVIKGSPDGRRVLLDRSTFNRFPAFLDESRAYEKALKNRNQLLKVRASPDELIPWEDVLATKGARLWVRRRELLAELIPRAIKVFEKIGKTPDGARVSYRPHHYPGDDFGLATEADLEAFLRAQLEARRGRDTDRGFTSIGPHVDDVEFAIGDAVARPFASQGQSRALVLAWKLGEIENLAAAQGALPLLLLDDVSSELDPDRNAFLMEYLATSGAQTLLTTTARSYVERAAGPDTQWLRVRAGTVSPL